MKQPFKIILIIAGVLAGLWTFARLTKLLQWYTVPTISNYPAVDKSDHVFASNLIKPKRMALICYQWSDADGRKEIWIHRLCGMAGDTIEMRDGVLLVNGQDADRSLSLAHNYVLSQKELGEVQGTEPIDETLIIELPDHSFLVYLSDKAAAAHGLAAHRHILPKSYADEEISKRYAAPWNQDHFGPVVVPPGNYFVLGDNRHNALDSRYIGFVDAAGYVGTVLGR